MLTLKDKEIDDMAGRIVSWIASQKFQGQDILHAAVCCDFVGHTKFVQAIAKILRDGPEHRHVAGPKGDIDTCRQCGNDIRHEIHTRIARSQQ